MKQKILLILLLLLAVMNVSAMLTFGYYKRCRSAGCIHKANSACESATCLCDELSLNDEQSKEMMAIRDRFSRKSAGLRKELCRLRAQLIEQLRVEATEEEINKTLSTICKIQMDLQREIVTNIQEEKTVLTTSQKELYFTLLSNCSPNRDAAGESAKSCNSQKKK